MTHDQILNKVTTAIDVLIHTAEKYDGLFPSLIDLNTHEMLDYVPAPIPGQRHGDRSHFGSNLIHDENTLRVMYALGVPEYTAAADRYLKRFATHCTDTVTGLFPWGEHSYWDLKKDALGNSSRYHDPKSTNPAIHDHLRQVPEWVWAKLWEFNPKCVERFAEGLDYHWRIDPPECSRHGEIEVKERPTDYNLICSFDFARHGGFYIQDWAFAYLKTGREDFRKQIWKMLDYWWPVRYSDGILPTCKRCTEKVKPFFEVHATGQTMGHAASLLDTAPMLEEKDPELAATLKERGEAYSAAFVNAPHDIENGKFLAAYKPDDAELWTYMPIWGSVYGGGTSSGPALLCLHAYRFMGDEKLLRWATAVAELLVKQPMPENVPVPANDAGLALGLLADMYDITGDTKWLNDGLQMAEKMIGVYLDGDIPRGAAGIDWYESQMGPSLLLHSLARIALLAKDRENCPLEPDYTSR